MTQGSRWLRHQQSGECIYMQNMQNMDSALFCILVSAFAYYFAYYSIFFCILWCILHCILFCILQHINLHIYAPICKIICQKIVHCPYSAYSAYCYMQNMQNMQLNMQKYVNEYAVICINMPNNMPKNSSLSIFCIFCILLYAEYAEYAIKYAEICQ